MAAQPRGASSRKVGRGGSSESGRTSQERSRPTSACSGGFYRTAGNGDGVGEQISVVVQLAKHPLDHLLAQFRHDDHVSDTEVKSYLRSPDQVADERQPVGVEEEAPPLAPVVHRDDNLDRALARLVQRVFDPKRLQGWQSAVR